MKYLVQILIVSILVLSCSKDKIHTKLESYMDAHAEINGFAGTVLITKNDSVLLKKAYGYADYEWKVEHNIDSKFSLASVSKQFTAVAILQLEEAKKLSLDEKLSKYYPGFADGDSITIEMLLTHNSGIGGNFDEMFLSNTAFDQDSVVSFIMTKPLLFEPNTQTAYSNVGYYLLATIIEKASGKSYSTYLREHIFDVAGMDNSGVSSNDSIVTKMVDTYYEKNGKLIKNPFTNWIYNIGHDGVYSTVEDLYLWNKSLFDDTILLSESMKSRMFTSYNGSNFGYGVLVNPFYNHGRNLVGHDGGFYGTQTSFNKFPDDDLMITVLSNNGSPSYLLAYGLSAIVFGIPVELPYKHIEVEVDTALFADYVGQYENIKILQKDGKLLYSDYELELIPESKTKFFRADNNDRTVEFIRDDRGIVTHIIVSIAGVKEAKSRQ